MRALDCPGDERLGREIGSLVLITHDKSVIAEIVEMIVVMKDIEAIEQNVTTSLLDCP